MEVMAIAGTGLQAVGAIQQGRAANAAAKFQAKQLEQRAKAERAVSQRQAKEQKRQIDLAESRARNLAAAGGTALTSPTVANILGGLDFEADTAFDTSLAIGEERAIGLETQASSARIQGKQAQRAGYINAAGKLASAGSSLYGKYAPIDTLSGGSGRGTIGSGIRGDRLF